MSVNGWKVRCPDGKIRHYPYTNHEDAEFDARVFDKKCAVYEVPSELEIEAGPCPGGVHDVEPHRFVPPLPGSA